MTQKTIYSIISAIFLGAILLGAGVVLAGTALTDVGGAQEPADSTQQTISVGATGTAEAPPDKAIVRLTVESRASDPGTARSQVAENVTKTTEALTEIGIDESDIQTEDFRIRQVHPHRPQRESSDEVFYVAQHRLMVEVDDVDAVGTVIDAAVDSGFAQINHVQFTLGEDTRTTLRNEALEDAMSQARGQASTIAGAEGLTIESVHSVSTQDIRIPHRRVEFAAGAGGDGGFETDLSSGPVQVTASVTVTYNASG